MSDTDGDFGKDGKIGGHLSEEDQRMLRFWRENLSFLDSRYHEKTLLKLVARAISDEEFRDRLVNDTDAVLAECDLALPDGMEVRFFDNTPNALHVVLPPPAGEMEQRPVALRESLRSRTAEGFFLFKDDFNLSDTGTRDNIFPPPHPPWPA
jgi:hypothetical protein